MAGGGTDALSRLDGGGAGRSVHRLSGVFGIDPSGGRFYTSRHYCLPDAHGRLVDLPLGGEDRDPFSCLRLPRIHRALSRMASGNFRDRRDVDESPDPRPFFPSFHVWDVRTESMALAGAYGLGHF